MALWLLWPFVGWIAMAVFGWIKYNRYHAITRGDIAGGFFIGAIAGPFLFVFAAIAAITSINWSKTVIRKEERW